LTDSHLYGITYNGVVMSGFPQSLANQFPFAGAVSFQPGLAVFDADGDGYPDIFCNTTQGHLMGFNPSGELMARLPMLWGDTHTGALSVGASATSGRVLWLCEAGGREASGYGPTQTDGRIVGVLPVSDIDTGQTAEWLGRFGGVDRSGPGAEAVNLGAWQHALNPDVEFIAYPNPARGDEARFRFQSGADGQATLTIFTLEGEIVSTLQKTVQSGILTEIVWPLHDKPSGVYLCKLTMPDAGGLEHQLLTLAVER
jgi:hypothetical protein